MTNEEVDNALMAAFAEAMNARLENAAVVCETVVQNHLCDTYGDGAECIASTEACAEMIRSFKITSDNITLVAE